MMPADTGLADMAVNMEAASNILVIFLFGI
jgi:hypothetical protein